VLLGGSTASTTTWDTTEALVLVLLLLHDPLHGLHLPLGGTGPNLHPHLSKKRKEEGTFLFQIKTQYKREREGERDETKYKV
jgi:hypothetical protein